MAVDDRWYYTAKRGPDGKKLPKVPKPACGIGKRYRARWTDDNGKTCTERFTSSREAASYAAAMQTDVSRGQHIGRKAGKITFRAYAERWRDLQSHAPSTRANVESHLRLHTIPFFGDRPLKSITTSDIQAFQKKITGTLAKSTVKVLMGELSAIFSAAVADRERPSSPCTGVKTQKPPKARVEVMPAGLVDAILAAMPPRMRALVKVGALAGLRISEALALEVDRVPGLEPEGVRPLRRDEPELRVEQQLMRVKGEPPYLAPPKTVSSRRSVPVRAELLEALTEHLREFPVRPVEILDRSGSKPVTRMARMIFTKESGKAMDWVAFRVKWRSALKTAGAAYVQAAPPQARDEAQALVDRFAAASFHDLRHFFASLLIAEGYNLMEVQAYLGHASARETEATYLHLWPRIDARIRRQEAVRVFGAGKAAA